MHRATSRFWECFECLPHDVQKLARKSFELLKTDPLYPSLRLKKVGKFWSVRIGNNYRALAVQDEEGFTWVWIGNHKEYDRMVTGKSSIHTSRQCKDRH